MCKMNGIITLCFLFNAFFTLDLVFFLVSSVCRKPDLCSGEKFDLFHMFRLKSSSALWILVY